MIARIENAAAHERRGERAEEGRGAERRQEKADRAAAEPLAPADDDDDEEEPGSVKLPNAKRKAHARRNGRLHRKRKPSLIWARRPPSARSRGAWNGVRIASSDAIDAT